MKMEADTKMNIEIPTGAITLDLALGVGVFPWAGDRIYGPNPRENNRGVAYGCQAQKLAVLPFIDAERP